jgi:hypothetical protein
VIKRNKMFDHFSENYFVFDWFDDEIDKSG